MVPIFEAKDVVFRYRDNQVLDGASVEIGEGEFFGILGPNGCGKTTLLKNLNRNLDPSSGVVMLDGRDVSGMDRKGIAREVATVPQGNEVRFAFTVRDVVSMGRMPFQGRFEGESGKDGEIIDSALEKTGLTSMAGRLINEMSGGERQRVIIARALTQTPRVLLMDEPTLHLDVNMQFEILDLMKSLSVEEGLTVVMVSHDLPLAARYCDRMALIKDHRIMCCGTPETALTPENMKAVFKVDADLGTDPKTGRRTVFLHGIASDRGSRLTRFGSTGGPSPIETGPHALLSLFINRISELGYSRVSPAG